MATYIERLREARGRLDEVDASLSRSFGLLSPELQERWPMLSVFPSDFDQRAATAVWAVEQEEADLSLDELVRSSLVKYNEKTERFVLHDLARAYSRARSRMT